MDYTSFLFNQNQMILLDIIISHVYIFYMQCAQNNS